MNGIYEKCYIAGGIPWNRTCPNTRYFMKWPKAGKHFQGSKGLYISQPAISKAISKLEDSLGLSLFTRSSRGVQLTSEGEILFEHTREAFDALDRGEQELKRIQEFDIGHLRIGVSNTLCKYILLPYLKTFIDQYPHMKGHHREPGHGPDPGPAGTAEDRPGPGCRAFGTP